MVPPPRQSTVRVSNQITLFILYCSRSRLVTLLKVIDVLYMSVIIFIFLLVSILSILAFRYIYIYIYVYIYIFY